MGAAALLPLLAGCTPVQLLNGLVPRAGVRVTRNVSYGNFARAQLDIYRPTGTAGDLPIVVFLYGGGWRSGSKDDYPFVATALARRGFITVVPDYRLYPAVQFPDFLQDCAQAVSWTLARAGGLGGDLSRVSVVGHSAGAYNAAMLGLDPSLLGAAGVRRSDLAGVVGIAGPYDFLPITDPDVIPVFASVGDGAACQPVSYVDGRNPPMLLLAGSADETVAPRNAAALASRIQMAGGPVRTILYPGLGHVGIVLAFADPFAWRAPVLDDVVDFLAPLRDGRKLGRPS